MAIDENIIRQVDDAIDEAISENSAVLNLFRIRLPSGATLTRVIDRIAKRFGHLTGLSLSFHYSLTDLQFLKFLTQISHARIESGRSILPQLQYLWLDGTQVSDASLTILAQAAAEGQLPRLQSLRLDGTQVSDASLTILAQAAAEGQLPKLQSLWLNNTQVSDASLTILAQAAAEGQLPKLQSLRLDNTQVSVPSEIRSGLNARRILQHYTDLAEAIRTGNVTRIAEAKLLILGQGHVGKSVLCERVFLAKSEKEQSQPPPPRQETQSFDAHLVPLQKWRTSSASARRQKTKDNSLSNEFRKSMQLRIWDFAGQDQLHGSHRFFVGARRAFYLLVLDASQSARRNRLGYWLRFIAQHGDLGRADKQGNRKAPVVIVLTQCDLRHEQVRQREPRDSDRDGDVGDLRHALNQAKERGYFGANVLPVGEHGADWIEGLGVPRCMDELPAPLQQQIRNEHIHAVQLLRQAIVDHLDQIVELQTPVPPAEGAVRDWVLEHFEIDAPDERFADEDPPLEKFSFDVMRVEESRAFLESMKERGLAKQGTEKFVSQIHNSLVMLKSLGLVHWIGDYLSSRHEEGKLMYKTVFNPRSVKTPVCRVLRGERVAYRCGRIDHEQCHQLLPDESLRQEIIDLMEGSQLLYHLIDSRHVNHGWLVPDLMREGDSATGDVALPDRLSHRWSVPFLPDRVLLQFLAHRILTHVKTHPQLTDEQWSELTRQVSRNFARLNWRDGGQDYIIEIETQINPRIEEEPWIRLAVSGGKEGRDDVFHDVWKDLNDILAQEGMQPLARVKFSGSTMAIPTVTQEANAVDSGRKAEIRRQLNQFNDAVQAQFGTRNQHGKVWDQFWFELWDKFVSENVGDFLEATLTVDQISDALVGKTEPPKKVKMKTPQAQQKKCEPKYQIVQTAMNKLSVNLNKFWRESLGGRADSMPIEISNSRRNEMQGVRGSYTIKLSIEKLLSVGLPKPDGRK